MQTENLIAASNITIDKGDGDAPGFGAFSKKSVWDSSNWMEE